MPSFIPDISNEMFSLAIRLVCHSSRNLFLTGKAGTGKTTFLKYLKENCLKEMAVVAPTGVAAINAGGVTIHSFFQLPLSPFVPDSKGFSGESQEKTNKHALISRLRINTEKKKVLQQLELLVIDEVSMVRCDTMDAIDTVLRHIRRRPMEPFGGVQVLFIGDLLQLPPVIRDEDWSILSEYYNGPYFFDSKVILEDAPLYIEFNKIYRQSDELFINLLNQVRNNILDQHGLDVLESRYLPGFARSPGDGYVVLTTHNEKARQINTQELEKLAGNLYSFKADTEGEFPDRAYPADQVLELKTGAQVMFIRNDTSDRGKRFFNGKIGVVSRIDDGKIWVICENESDEIAVPKEKWENIRYTVNRENRSVNEEVLGSFTQYPLRLAWAITIHKSQGLTFRKAIIDAGAAFAPGQVYVALSRCTNLEGMVLQTRIRTSSLSCDKRIVEYSDKSSTTTRLQEEFNIARDRYQQEFITELFSCQRSIVIAKELEDLLAENKKSFNNEPVDWTRELLLLLNKTQDTAEKFSVQLFKLFATKDSADNLQERLKAASEYFKGEFDNVIKLLNQSPAITDSRTLAREWNDQARELFAQVTMKKHLLDNASSLLDVESLQQLRRKFLLPPFTVNAYAANNSQKIKLDHQELYFSLKELRESICQEHDLPIYIVAGSQTLQEITRYLPQTLEELRKISGFGDAKVRKYGQQFLDIVIDYCKDKNLSSLIHEKQPKVKTRDLGTEISKRSNTKAETFRHFSSGLTVEEIAKERSLSRSTIENHLAHYVEIGQIPVEKLLSPEKLERIIPVLENYTEGPITPIKNKLGADISYSDIAIALASKKQKVIE